MCSMNTRKSIFFSQTSVRIQLRDAKGVKSQSENRKLDEETLVSMKVYLFHTDFSPSSFLRYQGRRGQRKNRRLTLCSMNTRKSIFFSQSSVRIQLQDIKDVENSAPKRYKASRLINFAYIIYFMYYCLL